MGYGGISGFEWALREKVLRPWNSQKTDCSVNTCSVLTWCQQRSKSFCYRNSDIREWFSPILQPISRVRLGGEEPFHSYLIVEERERWRIIPMRLSTRHRPYSWCVTGSQCTPSVLARSGWGFYFGFFFFFTCLAFPISISPIVRWDKPCLNVAGRNESRRITMNSINSWGEM